VAIAFLLDRAFAIFVVAYLLLQFGYTFAFKHMVILDVIAIGIGFVLRAVSGAALAIDPRARAQVYAQLKASPMIAGVASREAALTGIRETIARSMGLIALFVAGFAMMLVFGVVYNSGRIMLSERARDLASLRVLGYRKGEVAYVLLGALALLTLTALPIGSAIGVALSFELMQRFSNDLFTIPFGMRVATIAKGWLVVLAATAVTGLLIKWRVDRLDLGCLERGVHAGQEGDQDGDHHRGRHRTHRRGPRGEVALHPIVQT